MLELFSSIRHEYPFVEMEAVGEQGTLITRNHNYSTVFQTQAGAVPGTLRTSNMTVGEMEHFLACIRGQDIPRCSLSDMAYTGALSGRRSEEHVVRDACRTAAGGGNDMNRCGCHRLRLGGSAPYGNCRAQRVRRTGRRCGPG